MRIHVAPYLLLPHRPKAHPLIFDLPLRHRADLRLHLADHAKVAHR
jgi:hypothetical protein